MFGQQNNDQDNATQVTPTENTDAQAVAPSSEAFNPALPPTGGSFGNAVTPIGPSPVDDKPFGQSSAPLISDDLMDIKQQALSQLSPLVDHLEQTPEEKFRTTMMMIQASDNQELVKEAYAAAQQITDEKAKAQALLDIVNEINYFTQHHQG